MPRGKTSCGKFHFQRARNERNPIKVRDRESSLYLSSYSIARISKRTCERIYGFSCSIAAKRKSHIHVIKIPSEQVVGKVKAEGGKMQKSNRRVKVNFDGVSSRMNFDGTNCSNQVSHFPIIQRFPARCEINNFSHHSFSTPSR